MYRHLLTFTTLVVCGYAEDGITIQGNFRTRVEDWSWFQGDGGANNAYAFSGNLLRLAISQLREALDWQLEFSVPFLLGLPDNAIAAGTQGQLGLGARVLAKEIVIRTDQV